LLLINIKKKKKTHDLTFIIRSWFDQRSNNIIKIWRIYINSPKFFAIHFFSSSILWDFESWRKINSSFKLRAIILSILISSFLFLTMPCVGSVAVVGRCRVLIVPLVCFGGLARSALYCSSKIIDMLRNRASRLEMVMHLLSVVAANGGCGCYWSGRNSHKKGGFELGAGVNSWYMLDKRRL